VRWSRHGVFNKIFAELARKADADGGQEGMSASVVACMDAPPVLDPAEHVFDLVSLAIEFAVMFDRLVSV
jgi:hypothetical protein